MFGRIGRWLQGEAGGDRPLFVSHVPDFQAPEWAVGEFVEHEGQVFVVTRWLQGRKIPLTRGGSVQEWHVWGRPADPDELATAVERAAARLLAEGAEGRSGGGESGRPGRSG